MNFRIADTFTDSLARLTGDEQKAVKTTAFDLQLNPASPGMSFHRLDRAKDRNFWSVRAGRDVRVIVHRTDDSLMLCYAAHHDQAYRWAEHRKLASHPKTGAAQWVEIRERIQEVTVPRYVEEPVVPSPRPLLFADLPKDRLLDYGVPEEWLDDVLKADEDTLLALADRLPQEAAEALLELATGGTPAAAAVAKADESPFEHPDAMRRFRTMASRTELEQALEYPWEKWIVFLHPAQRKIVEGSFNGPVRVSGSAGTGKSIVALHRAVWLARRHPDARVLLTTFSDPLANALRARVGRLIAREPQLAERLETQAIGTAGLRLASAKLGKPDIVTGAELERWLAECADAVQGSRFTQHFLREEWTRVVDAWQLSSWDEYRDVQRLGRKTRLAEKQRLVLWDVFERVRERMRRERKTTYAETLTLAADLIRSDGAVPFDYVVVDEAQDMGVPEMRFFSALGGDRDDSLFFAGDLGQRIFQQPFSWRSLGIDIRGRSFALRVNYRTSHQIRRQADRLLPSRLSDFDGQEESREGTVSVFNGTAPEIRIEPDENRESAAVAAWLKSLAEEGCKPHEIGVFVRSEAQMRRAMEAVAGAGMECQELTEQVDIRNNRVSVGVMHLAKGLEFRAVAVMACDDEVLPLQTRIESVGDMADLEDVYNTERHLLYVACTRARDKLLVTAVDPPSEFIDDMSKQEES